MNTFMDMKRLELIAKVGKSLTQVVLIRTIYVLIRTK